MKKQTILALAAIAGLTGSISFPAQAANLCSGEESRTTKYIVVAGQTEGLPELKSVLADWCDRMQNGAWQDCPTIILPNCNKPEETIPEESVPEYNPEIDKPGNTDSDRPGSDVPGDAGSGNSEENVPEDTETGKPGNDVPEAEVPDTSHPNAAGEEGGHDSEMDVESQVFAERILELVNAERKKVGLHALTLDQEVSAAAQIRTGEIETSFSHTRPDGRAFSTVLTDNGISFRGAGENIAWGQTTPEQVMQAWMNSEGHRANILNSKYTKLGVGHYKNGNGRNYWVQLFTY